MLTTNGCIRLGTDFLNHSKGLFSNRALDKLSECQYNCPSMFKSSRTLQMVGRTYQVKMRQRKRNKKRRKRKEKKRKKKERKKERKKVKATKQKGKKGRRKEGKKIEERKKKEKRVGIKYLNKRKYCVGTEPKCIVIYRHSSNFYYRWSCWLSG